MREAREIRLQKVGQKRREGRRQTVSNCIHKCETIIGRAVTSRRIVFRILQSVLLDKSTRKCFRYPVGSRDTSKTRYAGHLAIRTSRVPLFPHRSISPDFTWFSDRWSTSKKTDDLFIRFHLFVRLHSIRDTWNVPSIIFKNPITTNIRLHHLPFARQIFKILDTWSKLNS